MGLLRRKSKKSLPRHLKPLEGRSLSSNTYYRPRSTSLSSVEKSQKKQNTSDSNKNKLEIPNVGRVVNWAIIASFVILIFFATTLSASADIKIPTGSYTYRDKSEYQQTATKLLNESLLNRSKVLFSSQDFEQKMQSEYPEIANIEAIVPLGGRNLSVNMRVSQPLAVVINGEQKGIMDDNGILINKEISSSDLYTIRFATPQDNFEIGSRLFTHEEIDLLKLLAKEMSVVNLHVAGDEKAGLTIKDVLFNVRDGQFEVRMNELPYMFKLSSYADSAEQVGAVKVTLLELHNDLGQPPTKYIDARVPGRVFVL